MLALGAIGPRSAHAINANPAPIDLKQSDGTAIRLHLMGDEWGSWYEDMQGYTVVFDSGSYAYARRNAAGALESTDLLVGHANPASASLERHVRASASWTNARMALVRPAKISGGITPSTGVIKNLVILALFKDQTIAGFTRPRTDYVTLFNAVAGDITLAPTGSVRDAYLEYSRGLLDLQSTVVDWVTLPQNEAYYANADSGLSGPCPTCSQQMVIDALNAANGTVDFGQFDRNNDGYVDAIDIIHSGYGSEQDGNVNRIWSHKSTLAVDWDSGDNNTAGHHVKVFDYHTEPALWGTSGTVITRIGVITHETGHFFGLPDLYDRDGSSSGIGSYCLMSNSWGFDNDQLRPPHPSAWCKIQLGWITPITPAGSATYTLFRSENYPDVVKLATGYANSNEYLLVENRQPVGLDSRLPQGGLAVWHIDETLTGIQPNNNEGFPSQAGWPGNGNHYKIALLQADGKYELEQKIDPTFGVRGGDAGDLYHDISGVALSDLTTPNTDAYMAGDVFPTANTISAISASGTTMSFHYDPATWVDFAWNGVQTGLFWQPYKTLAQGVAAAPVGSIVMFKPGTTAERPTLNTSVQLKSWGGTTIIGRP